MCVCFFFFFFAAGWICQGSYSYSNIMGAESDWAVLSSAPGGTGLRPLVSSLNFTEADPELRIFADDCVLLL